MQSLSARTERLIQLVEEGATLAEAGRVYGIGRERVRQILEREGISTPELPDREERRRARRSAAHRHHAPAMEAMWRSGMSCEEIGSALALPSDTVRSLIWERVSPEERRRQAAAKLAERRAPDEWFLQAIRNAARVLGRTPGVPAYDRLRAQGLVEGPSGRAITRRWGWARACELAGLTPNRRRPRLGRPTYSDDDYRTTLRRVAHAVGKPPTLDEYGAHRSDGEPSASAFRLRYGGWLRAREELLERDDDRPRDSTLATVEGGRNLADNRSPDAARDASPAEAPRTRYERTEHLVELVEQGATLAEAGRVYGIGRERVRQILEREGVSVKALPRREQRRRARRLARHRELAPAMEAMWRQGMVYEEIADALALSPRTVQALICERVPHEQRNQRMVEKLSQQRSPDEWVLQSLRDAARILGRTPGRAAYDRLRAEERIDGLSGDGIAYRWGGWAKACELAGLTPNPRQPHLGRPTYSEDQYRAALSRVADYLGKAPTKAEYCTLKRDGEPSAQAFELRYGGWLNARAEALGEPAT